MAFATPAKDEQPLADIARIASVPVGMMSPRMLDPDFTPEAIARQTRAFERAGGKVKQIPIGVVHDMPSLTGLQVQHMGGGKARVNITLSTSRQRAAKEKRAQQQWKESGAQ